MWRNSSTSRVTPRAGPRSARQAQFSAPASWPAKRAFLRFRAIGRIERSTDPQVYLTDVLTRLVNLWPAARIDELMPWAWTGADSGGLAA